MDCLPNYCTAIINGEEYAYQYNFVGGGFNNTGPAILSDSRIFYKKSQLCKNFCHKNSRG